jgi:hypothetical protein
MGNGSWPTSKDFDCRAYGNGLTLDYPRPCKPAHTRFIESLIKFKIQRWNMQQMHPGYLRHQYFYDQAHFIKEFKCFTGLSPLKFAKSENEFGRIFYRD